MKVRAIIFDLDDTLYDPMQPFNQAYQKHLPQMAAEVSVNRFYLKSRAISDALFEKQQLGQIDIKEVQKIRIIEAAKAFGYEVTEDLAMAFQDTYAYYQGHLTLLEGYAAFFKKCQEQGIFLGVITNGPGDLQRKKLHSLQLAQYIPEKNWLISGEVDLMKPQREIFEYYQKAHQLDQAIYVGDSFENDVVGANQVNWPVYWFNHRQRQKPANHATFKYQEVSHLAELLTALQQELAI
ncbi:HAD family hydrolase [Enterococcus cecorum]|uniref:HAD family hydrolase n=1 Tax=Enterococcus cecorum TaxID=44008 RepID=UPI00200ADF46|nr:HAD family hydrolase [Enterococcus cecorum]